MFRLVIVVVSVGLADSLNPSTVGPALAAGPGWRLRSLCEQDGFLFLRYRPQ